jgi:hypothetical protein
MSADANAAPPSQGWTLKTIPWKAAAPNGTRDATLEGSETAEGQYTYAFSIPGGFWDSPHSHGATARVFVAKGVLMIGYGEQFDRSKLKSYPAGSYVVVPAGTVHFDGSDVDTVIIGTSVGPFPTTYVDGSLPGSSGVPAPKKH